MSLLVSWIDILWCHEIDIVFKTCKKCHYKPSTPKVAMMPILFSFMKPYLVVIPPVTVK